MYREPTPQKFCKGKAFFYVTLSAAGDTARRLLVRQPIQTVFLFPHCVSL